MLNPIEYIYLKDKRKYSKENELRISLSAFPIGQFALDNGEIIDFPLSLMLPFDFQAAFEHGVILKIICKNNEAFNLINTEVTRLRLTLTK